MDTQDLAVRFSDTATLSGYAFDCLPIAGEMDLLQITLEHLQEFPVFVYASDAQILCVTYLWTESEVRAGTRTAMLETMMDMNIAIPLSSFARIGERYVLFGAIGKDSRFESVVTEIVTLSENAADALQAMEDFLS